MKRLWSVCLAVGLSCSLAAAREFPICVYSVSSTNGISDLKEAGFTCFQSYLKNPEKLAPLVKEARRLGLKTIFYPNEIIGSDYEKQAQTWPMLAWYLVDEPDVHKWTREQVLAAHQKTKQSFPTVPTALVIGQGKTKTPFYDLPDIMMVDWYPVPHLPLESFGKQVRLTREEMTQRGVAQHPLWGVVQIFDWKQEAQNGPVENRIGRFPTTQEIRFMAYHGILEGADGLFFFPFHQKGVILPKAAPDYWARVRAVSKEISALRPILEKGKISKNAVEVETPLLLQTRKYRWKKYAILLNASGQEQPLPRKLQASKYKLLYGGETTKKSEKIPPYGVWVLKY